MERGVERGSCTGGRAWGCAPEGRVEDGIEWERTEKWWKRKEVVGR